MKKERMKILEMIEQGKISVEDGARLLEAIPHYHSTDFDREEFKQKLDKLTKSADAFSRDLGDKMSAAFKDMEPTLRNATKKAIVHTANAVDGVSKYLNETLKKMEPQAEPQDEADECCEGDCADKDEGKDEELYEFKTASDEYRKADEDDELRF